MPDGANPRLPPEPTPPAPPFKPLRPDGSYDRRAIMAEAHLRVTMLRELEPWTRYRETLPAALREAWADAQRAAGDGPEVRYLLELIEEAEAERDCAGDFN